MTQPDLRNVCLCTLILLLPVGSVRAQPVNESTSVIQSLEGRYAELDHLFVEYDWSECRGSLERDPFDRSTWEIDKFAHTLHCQLWVIRPHYRLHYSGPFGNQKSVDRAWINGVYTSKQLDDDGWWSVKRDRERWTTTGPIPIITPLELWQVFDIRESLLDLLKAGKISPLESRGGTLTLHGDRLFDPPEEWMLTASLDEMRGFLPLELAAQLKVPGGDIKWKMRTLSSTPVGSVHAIKEAVLALSNTAINQEKWQIYHFLLLSVRRDDTMTTGDLEPDVPSAKVKLLDELALEYREVDDSGQIVAEQKWTAEERKADREGVRATLARIKASEGIFDTRRRVLGLLVIGSALLAVLVLGVWRWRRRV